MFDDDQNRAHRELSVIDEAVNESPKREKRQAGSDLPQLVVQEPIDESEEDTHVDDDNAESDEAVLGEPSKTASTKEEANVKTRQEDDDEPDDEEDTRDQP